MDNSNKELNDRQNPKPLSDVVSSDNLNESRPANVAQNPTQKKSLLIKLLLIIGVSFGILWIGFLLFLAFAGLQVKSHCNGVKKQVWAEQRLETTALNKINIITGQRTQAIAGGNTDCLDGGVGSVSATAEFKTSGTFTQLTSDINSNLGEQGYTQIGKLQLEQNGVEDSGRSLFNTVKAIYKKNSDEYLGVSYVLTQKHPYICQGGYNVCTDPDLQELSSAPVATVKVTTNPDIPDESLTGQ